MGNGASFKVVGWFVASTGLFAIAASTQSWLPSSFTVNAYALAERCQTYRAAERLVTEQLTDVKAQMQTEEQEAKRLRTSLEECAKNRGMKVRRTPLDEALLAEVCLQEYEAWLSPGMRVQILGRELQEVSDTLREVKGALHWRCGALPKVAGNTF